jgi:hypothetical protein
MADNKHKGQGKANLSRLERPQTSIRGGGKGTEPKITRPPPPPPPPPAKK